MGYPNHPKVATVHRRGFNYGNLKRPPKGFERSIFRLRPALGCPGAKMAPGGGKRRGKNDATRDEKWRSGRNGLFGLVNGVLPGAEPRLLSPPVDRNG